MSARRPRSSLRKTQQAALWAQRVLPSPAPTASSGPTWMRSLPPYSRYTVLIKRALSGRGMVCMYYSSILSSSYRRWFYDQLAEDATRSAPASAARRASSVGPVPPFSEHEGPDPFLPNGDENPDYVAPYGGDAPSHALPRNQERFIDGFSMDSQPMDGDNTQWSTPPRFSAHPGSPTASAYALPRLPLLDMPADGVPLGRRSLHGAPASVSPHDGIQRVMPYGHTSPSPGSRAPSALTQAPSMRSCSTQPSASDIPPRTSQAGPSNFAGAYEDASPSSVSQFGSPV
jgi:hypothetical protein